MLFVILLLLYAAPDRNSCWEVRKIVKTLPKLILPEALGFSYLGAYCDWQ